MQLIARLASAFNNNTTPKTAGTFNVVAGDVITVKAVAEDAGKTFSAPTGLAGATWTQRVNVGTSGSSGRVAIWTTVAPSTVSGVTISVAAGGSGLLMFGVEVVQRRDAAVGAVWSGGIATGSGTPSVAQTAQSAGSALETAGTDWNAVAITGRTYLTADAGAFTETTAALVSGQYAYYIGYHANAGAATSKTLGMSAPSGQRWTFGAVEMRDTAPAGTTYDRSGATVTAQSPAASVARTRERVRTGSVEPANVPSASVSKVNPITHTGTIAVGRIAPVRSGSTVAASVVSGSRAVGSATAYNRSGATITAQVVSASRAVGLAGTTRIRTGTVATGRIPTVRSGSTTISTGLAGSWILGNPGATFDRAGMVVTGRVATSRSGSTTSSVSLTGTRILTPAGRIDRTGGNAGGSGQPSGLLLALQAHPGATLSATVRVDSNVPLRTAAVVGKTRLSAERAAQRSRTGSTIVAGGLSASRIQSGNRNRNGLITSGHDLSGFTVVVHVAERTGQIVATTVVSGSAGIGVTPVYGRTVTVTVSTVLSGRVTVRRSGARTYVWAPITTGYIASPSEEGVVVA